MRIATGAALALLCAQGAWGTEPNVDPEKICEHQKVNKIKLAIELLQTNNAPISALQWAQQTSARPPEMDPFAFLVVYGEQACKDHAEGLDCVGGRLTYAFNDSVTFLEDAMHVGPWSGVYEYQGPKPVNNGDQVQRAILEFFRNPDYQVMCLPQTPRPKKEENEKHLVDVRIRGLATDLYVPQLEDAFKTVDKATLSYTQDDIKNKRVRVGSGVVGVGFQLSGHPLWGSGVASGSVHVVPYLGMASNITKASGSEPSVTTNTRQVGLMFYGDTNKPFEYYWTFRPDLLWNLRDRSRLLTVSMGYLPILADRLNATREIADGYWWQWILDGRFVHGHYTTLGTRKPEDARDFDRIGGDVGFQFDHAGNVLPWSWKMTESYLRGWNGTYKNLSQLKSVWSFWLDDNKLVGIDFIYTDGRDPNTAEKDKSWKISVGVKY